MFLLIRLLSWQIHEKWQPVLPFVSSTSARTDNLVLLFWPINVVVHIVADVWLQLLLTDSVCLSRNAGNDSVRLFYVSSWFQVGGVIVGPILHIMEIIIWRWANNWHVNRRVQLCGRLYARMKSFQLILYAGWLQYVVDVLAGAFLNYILWSTMPSSYAAVLAER